MELEFPRFDGHFLRDGGVWFSCRERGTRTLRSSGIRRFALARSGRSVGSLAREFEPCAATIHGWVKHLEIDDGGRDDGLTREERAELRRLRREVTQLRQERDILSKGEPLKAPLVQAQWRTPGLHEMT